jgi:transcription antitermination factor NusG
MGFLLLVRGRSYMLNGFVESSVANHDPRLAWYAVYTRHQHEKTVARILTIKGFEILLPLYPVTSRWKDRTKLLSLPLFPCYVFLRGGLDRRLDIVTTPGIHALVSNAGQPAAIPPSEIDAIQRAVQSGSGLEPHPFLECGEWVRVKRGPLEGIEGILVRKKSLYRLVLSVKMLGKAASVEVDAFLVERTNGKSSGARAIGYPAAPVHAGSRIAGLAT